MPTIVSVGEWKMSRLVQILDALEQPMLRDVVEKLAPDPETTAADLDLARRLSLFDPGGSSLGPPRWRCGPPSLELRGRLVSRLADLVQDRSIAPRRSMTSL